MSLLNVDAINESTAAAGVAVEGVLVKDSIVNTDNIAEKTAAAGVTIDGVLIKDSLLKIPGGSPGADKVLTSDADGNATWATAAGGVDGIVSSANATAITIDASEVVVIGGILTPTLFFKSNPNGYLYSLATYNQNLTGTTNPMLVQSDGSIGCNTSTRRAKKNIVDIEDSDVELLKDLKPRKFNFRVKTPFSDDGKSGGEYTDETHTMIKMGLIAEEVKEICEAKNITNSGYYGVDDEGLPNYVVYEQFIAPLIKGYQNILAKNDALEARLLALEGG